MGMFDIIKFKMKCPRCGKEMRCFQSKSGLCTLAELDFWEVDVFYDNCESCGTVVTYKLRDEFIPKRPKYTIDQYDMIVELPRKEE